MKQLATLAFTNGLTVGMNSIAVLLNGFSAIAAAARGDVIMALASYAVAVAAGVIGWRAWQRHQRGRKNLGKG